MVFGSERAVAPAHSSRDKRSASLSPRKFTLVELLIVITVIAMLTALLLPALNKSKETSRRISCSSKMSQLGLCFSMYGNDNNDFVFPGYCSSFGYDKSYDYAVREYFDNSNEETLSFYRRRGYLECPSDKEVRDLPNRLRSYCMSLGGWNYTVASSQRGPTSVDGTCRFTQITAPAGTVLFFECRNYYNVTGGTSLSATNGYFRSTDVNTLGKGATYGHGKGWNFAFCDGHVELININDWRIGLMTIDPTD